MYIITVCITRRIQACYVYLSADLYCTCTVCVCIDLLFLINTFTCTVYMCYTCALPVTVLCSLSPGQIIGGILEKFKEKKQMVVVALRDAADAAYPSVGGGRERELFPVCMPLGRGKEGGSSFQCACACTLL